MIVIFAIIINIKVQSNLNKLGSSTQLSVWFLSYRQLNIACVPFFLFVPILKHFKLLFNSAIAHLQKLSLEVAVGIAMSLQMSTNIPMLLFVFAQ